MNDVQKLIDELRDRGRVRHGATELRSLCLDAADFLARQAQQINSLTANADRYLWIRDQMPRPEVGQNAFWIRRGADLDEACDAAIKGDVR